MITKNLLTNIFIFLNILDVEELKASIYSTSSQWLNVKLNFHPRNLILLWISGLLIHHFVSHSNSVIWYFNNLKSFC